MNNPYPAITAPSNAAISRNKAELALWLVGMVLASLYVLFQ